MDQPPYYDQGPRDTGRGVVVLVLGILSLVSCGCLAGIPAWVMGNGVIEDVYQGRAARSELGIAQAGRILGMISTALSGCAVFVWVIAASSMERDRERMSQFMPRFDPNKIIEDLDKGYEKRHAILEAAIAERKRHPKKNFKILADELTKAKNGHVAWYDGDVRQSPGCGKLSFKAGNGTFTIADDCNSTGMSGWPPLPPGG